MERKRSADKGVRKMGSFCYTQEQLEKIRRRAFVIWEKKGKPKGSSVDDWHEAERQLKEAREI